MQIDYLPYRSIRYYTNLVCDYLDQKHTLRSFYHRFPILPNFEKQLIEKQLAYPSIFRPILVQTLKNQYANLPNTQKVSDQILLLNQNTTFSVTTGHQLNLFTGPLYVIYKICSTIRLAQILNQNHSAYHFVPIFWMATEDHDFDEINHFYCNAHKIIWDTPQTGAVGDFDTKGLATVRTQFENAIHSSVFAEELKDLFTRAYLQHQTLAAATRYLIHEIFSEEGLVILDPNDSDLKKLWAPFAKTELRSQHSYQHIQQANSKLKNLGYHTQVHPRELNLFYLQKGKRTRIQTTDNSYQLVDTNTSWTQDAMLSEVDRYPNRFSPNVIFRPLYQEIILPNLCYVGGAGELSYWLSLKSYFDRSGIPFPILLMRNSVLIKSQKDAKKLDRLGIDDSALFASQHELIDQKTKALSPLSINFDPERKLLQDQFAKMYQIAQQTDPSFIGAVKAQEKKQLNGLNRLEKRLHKAERRRLQSQLNHAIGLQDKLFPNGNLQERSINFSEMYLKYGREFIPTVLQNLNPLQAEFTILTL